MKTRANPKRPSIQGARWTAQIVDFCWIGGLVALAVPLFQASPRWIPWLHLSVAAFGVVLLSYFFVRLRGATPGQSLAGLQSRTPEGGAPERVYDWLFGTRLEPVGEARSVAALAALATGAFVFLVGCTSTLWFRDPTLRPWSETSVPLFAPEAAELQSWQVLPYFYATGALPRVGHPSLLPSPQDRALSGVEYSLPYEKGPPQRFLGRIVAYWRPYDSTVSLTGPMTAPAPESVDDLRRCSMRWFGCVGARRKIWAGSVTRWFHEGSVEENRWFEVENGFLEPSERPRGFHLRSRPDRERIREGYFLVGPRMAVQGLILDRPVGEKGDAASALLAKIVGSTRVSPELQAPRAFLNPKLAALRIGPKSTLAELVEAEAMLLSKVSIEPKDPDSFYHLAGLAVTLFREAKARGSVELAATSKAVVTNALRYLRDVAPSSPRIPEMERFDAEVEAR
jgi:hypothetical protein